MYEGGETAPRLERTYSRFCIRSKVCARATKTISKYVTSTRGSECFVVE